MERLNYVTLSTTRAKHRAARRPISQVIVDAAGDNLSSATKRTVAVAATSGLLVSILGTPAQAADTTVSVGTADVSALTSQARAQLQAAPAVTVADASWSVSVEVVEPVKVKPAPEVRKVETPAAPAASRSAARAAVADTAADEAPAKSETKTAPPAAASGSAVIDIASRYVGVPYVYGGTTPNGFDCSGFTSYVFAQLGIDLPRSSGAQRGVGTVVSRSEAKPGDLIWTPGHISIYAGGNTQIDAPRPGKSIQFRKIWQSNPTFIRVG